MKKISIGNCFKIERAFSKKEVLLYANLSGDLNPIHTDEDYASKTIFKKPICHGRINNYLGLLTSSLFSNLLGNNLTGSIYLKQSLNFLRPIYIDEKVEASLKITKFDENKNYIFLQTRVLKLENNELAIDGEAQVKFADLKKYL